MSLIHEWNKLDRHHKKFVLRVRDGGGGKHAAAPHYCDSDEKNEYGFKQIALCHKAEESGFIECVGSHKWITTNKFAELEAELFAL